MYSFNIAKKTNKTISKLNYLDDRLSFTACTILITYQSQNDLTVSPLLANTVDVLAFLCSVVVIRDRLYHWMSCHDE